MAADEEKSPTQTGYKELGPAEDAVSEAERSERADTVYARYSAAMTFFGETPAPKGKVPRD